MQLLNGDPSAFLRNGGDAAMKETIARMREAPTLCCRCSLLPGAPGSIRP
jgi:hypothetical protein